MIAIVGCGSAGSRIARQLMSLGAQGDICGYDYDPSACKSWPAELPISQTVQWPEMKAVKPAQHRLWYICTPADARVGWYREALSQRSTRAVFAEKPLCGFSDVAAISEAAAVASARGIVTRVGYCWRWHPAVRAAREWLRETAEEQHDLDQDSGRLYRFLRNVRAEAHCYSKMARWPGRSYGHPLLEFSHEVDTLSHLLGPMSALERVPSAGFGDAYELRAQHHSGATSRILIRADYDGGHYRSLLLDENFGSRFEWHTRSVEDLGVVKEYAAPRGIALTSVPTAPPDWEFEHVYRDELMDFGAADVAQGLGATWPEGLEYVRLLAAARGARG